MGTSISALTRSASKEPVLGTAQWPPSILNLIYIILYLNESYGRGSQTQGLGHHYGGVLWLPHAYYSPAELVTLSKAASILVDALPAMQLATRISGRFSHPGGSWPDSLLHTQIHFIRL